MNVAELKAKGGFVPLAPVKRDVVWTRKTESGETEELKFSVFIKKHSFGTIEQIWSGDDDKRSKSAAYIAQSIRLGDKGQEALTYEDAYQLDTGLATVLIAAINEVNGTGDAKPKN